MKAYTVTDEEAVKTGLRLAGVDGSLVKSAEDAARAFEKVFADEEIAVVFATAGALRLYPKARERLHTAGRPLLAVVPGLNGEETGEAVG